MRVDVQRYLTPKQRERFYGKVRKVESKGEAQAIAKRQSNIRNGRK